MFDAAVFAARLKEAVPPPGMVVLGAAKMIKRDAAMTVSGDENCYASTGLADIATNAEVARTIADLMKAFTGKTDPSLVERIDAGLRRRSQSAGRRSAASFTLFS